MPKKQFHSGLVRTVKEWLILHKWFVYSNKMSMGSHKGLSDLTAIRYNRITRVVWLEIKVGKDSLSVHQMIFRKNIEEHGGEYWVVRDIDDLKGCE